MFGLFNARLVPALLLSSVVALLSCDVTEEDFVDVGRVCVSGNAGEAQTVSVAFPTCLSSSCDTLVDAACDASLQGATLTVTARGTVRSKGGMCTDDCGEATVTCETTSLAEGSYTLRYGEQEGSLVIPNDEPTCLGEGGI